MAQIALIIESLGPAKAAVLQELRALAPVTVAEAMNSVVSGQPVFVQKLFDRKNPEFAGKLLSFLEWMDSHSVPYKALQVLDTDRFELSRCDKYYRVDADRLRTMISSRAASLEEQRRIGRLQDGVDE